MVSPRELHRLEAIDDATRSEGIMMRSRMGDYTHRRGNPLYREVSAAAGQGGRMK